MSHHKLESLEEHLRQIVASATEEAKAKFHALVRKAAEQETYFPDGIDMRKYFNEIKAEKAKIEAERNAKVEAKPKEEPKAEEPKKAPAKKAPAKRPAAKRAPKKTD